MEQTLAGTLGGAVVILAQVVWRLINGKGDSGHVAVAQAIERQAVATAGLTVVLNSITDRLQEQGEALRRIEVGQAHVIAAVKSCPNGRRDS